MPLWESILYIFNDELSNYYNFCLLGHFTAVHPLPFKLNNEWSLNFFINLIHTTFDEYSSIHYSRYYLLYKYRCVCFMIFNYTLTNLDFIFNKTLHLDVILYSYDCFINDITNYVPYITDYNWECILETTTITSPLRSIKEMCGYFSYFFDESTTILFEDIIKELYCINPMIQEIALRQQIFNDDMCMYSTTVGNQNLLLNFVSSTIVITMFYGTLFIYVLMIFISLLNFFKKKNFIFSSIILNQINKALEYDFGPISELKFFILFIYSIFLFCLFKNLNLALNLFNFNDFFIFYFLFIMFICFMYPCVILLCMGIYFFTYVKGTELKKSYLLNFFFDFMAMVSYFSRFILQLVRLLFFLVIYYMLHEYFYEEILTNIISFYNVSTYKNFYLIDCVITILRFSYELSDLVMIMVLQSLAFFSVMFILFSFLFTANLNVYYEKFFKKKN